MTCNDNTWLLHPGLENARVALSQTFDRLRRCEEWTQDLDIFWNNLKRITTAQPLMSSAMQLPVARREAQAGIDTATDLWSKLTNEAQMRLNHLQKLANDILDKQAKTPIAPKGDSRKSMQDIGNARSAHGTSSAGACTSISSSRRQPAESMTDTEISRSAHGSSSAGGCSSISSSRRQAARSAQEPIPDSRPVE